MSPKTGQSAEGNSIHHLHTVQNSQQWRKVRHMVCYVWQKHSISVYFKATEAQKF